MCRPMVLSVLLCFELICVSQLQAGGLFQQETNRISRAAQESNTHCTLPAAPEHGRYSVGCSGAPAVVAQEVPEYTVLLFSCDRPTHLIGATTIICINKIWNNDVPRCSSPWEECSAVPHNTSAVYSIQPPEIRTPFKAYCEMKLLGGKWTVIQSRHDDSVDFYRNFEDYTDGFGSPDGNYWLGLERIHQLTKKGIHELYIELESFDGTKAFARYSRFSIGSIDTDYRLTVEGYSGNAGESLTGVNNGKKFSTFDKNNIECAKRYHGGWWYSNCGQSNLNGMYYSSAVVNDNAAHWFQYSREAALKSTRMLIKKK